MAAYAPFHVWVEDAAAAWGAAMLQVDAFASDSVRMIKDVRLATGNPDLQILLFSATFNEKVKNFAMKVVPGANQARTAAWSPPWLCVASPAFAVLPGNMLRAGVCAA